MSTNIVADAERVITLLNNNYTNNKGKTVRMLSKSQIRKFLTAFVMVTNKVEIAKRSQPKAKEIPVELVNEIQFLKVKLVYQAGRDDSVHAFIDESKLLQKIDAVGNSFERYQELANYMEALVAYHKFYGGKD